ncbi:MAG: transcriptional regulator [Candidatus Saccharimonadales bacterium]
MVEQLFGSKTRVKLLHLFCNNPNRSFYVREITRKIEEQINSVRRELSNLLSIGIIKSDTSGNRLYYEVNQDHPYYKSLRSMFTYVADEGADSSVTSTDMSTRFRAVGSVDYVALSGVLTRDDKSPVDILIVGDVNKSRLDNLISEIESEEGGELRYTVLSRGQYDYRYHLKDKFLNSVFNSKKTVVIDRIHSEDEDTDKNNSKPKKSKE